MDEKMIVIFYDEDEKTILDKQEVNKGEKVTYQGKLPEKPAENGIEYTFVNWRTTGNLDKVMQDIQAYAQYEESSKMSSKEENAIFELSEANAEQANLNEVMRSWAKSGSSRKSNERNDGWTKNGFSQWDNR